MNSSIITLAIVLATFLLVPLACRKLRIPSIVGLLIAGMLLGKHALGWIPDSKTIDILGRMGMLYILFQSGVELDLNDFRSYSKSSLLLGLLSFALPMGGGLLLGHYIFGYGWTTSLLIAAMLGSHTLMTYPIVSRYGISRNRAVNISVGGSMIAITLALIVLVVLETSRTSAWDMNIVLRVIGLIFFLGSVLWLFPEVAQWLLRHRIDISSQFMMVMLMMVLSSMLAVAAGVDGILGAFLCGLALNQRIPNRSPLMESINFTGNTIFVPVFLIGVGAMIDIHACWSGWEVWVLALAMIVTKLMGKWLSSAVVQIAMHMTSTERQLIFGLTHSASAGTLAIATVGYEMGELSPAVMNATIIMILVLCTTSSFITEMASKRQALREETLLESDRDEDRWVLMQINPHTRKRQVETLRELARLSSLPEPEYIQASSWKDAISQVEDSWESTIIYHEAQPLQTINRILVALPRYAEKEHDFISCFGQVRRLSSELGARVIFFCTEDSQHALRAYCQRPGKYLRAEYRRLDDYQQILSMRREAGRDDLVIFLCARKNTISYDSVFRLMPQMINRFFANYSYLLLYPEQGK